MGIAEEERVRNVGIADRGERGEGEARIAALQTIGAAALPFASAYKDVFAFAVVIVLMALRPTGLIGEKASERV